MKILFVTSFFTKAYGGAEISTEILANELRRKGHEVLVLTTRKTQEKDNDVLSIPRTSWIPKKLMILGNPILDKFISTQLKKVIEETQSINILHIQDTYILPAGVLIAKKLGIPIVATVRNNVIDWVFDPILSFPLSFLPKRRNKTIVKCLNQLNAVISVSKYIKSELVTVSVDPSNIYPIYNASSPWDVHNAIQRHSSSKVVLFALGRLAKEKGFSVLIKALRLIIKKEDHIQLIIAGDGPERKNLEKMVRKLELTSFVRFTGKLPQNKIRELYLNCDVVLFTPIHPEPLGRVSIEAMMLGKPVIASEVGGIPEVVEDNITGILVPPNVPERLAEVATRLIKDKDLREKMGKEGKKVAFQKFNGREIVEQHLKVYEQVVER